MNQSWIMVEEGKWMPFAIFSSVTHLRTTTDMPTLWKIPALLRARCIDTTKVVSGQETTGTIGLFCKTELAPVDSDGCVPLNEVLFVHSKC